MTILTIGSLRLEAPFFLAPMSGYTEWPMRKLSRRFGCPLGVSGLLMDKMILHHGGPNQPIAVLDGEEHPVGAQLLGDDPTTMAQAARMLHQNGYDLIDLNFSCPAPKVLRTGRGGFLLAHPDRIIEIARAVRDAVPCPVTMKLRIGYNASELSQERFRLICRQTGVIGMDAIIIHGRTVEERFHGRANWDAIAQVKWELPGMTVIGSGDLSNAEIAVEKIRSAAVDGVAIARGAIGNPWFFRDLREILAGKTRSAPPTPAELAEVMIDHFVMMETQYGALKALAHFRKFLSGYCKRHPHRKKVLLELMTTPTADALTKIIENWRAEPAIN
jgi:tRNA-dihydrouridine synthase B